VENYIFSQFLALKNQKMKSSRDEAVGHHSISSFEVMLSALFIMLMVFSIGLIAVSWLAVKESEGGKSCPEIRKVF
jgi:hypothetical protein